MLTAKQIRNDYWILRQGSAKVGNIQMGSTGVDLTFGDRTRKFANLEDLGKQVKIQFQRFSRAPEPQNQALGFPTATTAFNPEWDVTTRLPLYTTKNHSKSKRCAGYYLVTDESGEQRTLFCPKLIALKRLNYRGPFVSEDQIPEL